MSDFPTLDAARPVGNTEFRRAIIDVFRSVEAYIEEIDGWISMPLRLVHDTAGGFKLELGPYDLDAADIHTLRIAIAAHDRANGRTTARAIEGKD